MASRLIILNSRFQPFSYQEMLHPVATATQAHLNLEMEMGDLSSQAALIASFANELTDPISYNKYKMYAALLLQLAEELGSRGLTPGSRRGLVSARDSFAKDIMPIALAHLRKMLLVEELRLAFLQNPTFFTDRDANTISLDELVADPSTSYTPASGIALEQQVATRVQHLAKRFSEDPAELRTILNGQQFEYVKARGFDPSVIAATIMQTEGGSELLNSIVEETIAQSGIANWNNPEALLKAYSYARQGLWAAVGEEQMQLVANQDYAFNQKVALMRMQQQMAQLASQGINDTDFRAMGLDVSLDSNKEVLKIQELIDTLEGNSKQSFQWYEYFTKPELIFKTPENIIKTLEERLDRYDEGGAKWYELSSAEGVDWNLDLGPLGKLNILTTDRKHLEKSLSEYKEKFNTVSDKNLLKYGIDPTLPVDEQISELKRVQKEANVMYTSFDLTGAEGSYDNMANYILGVVTDQKADKKRMMNNIYDSEGRKAKVNNVYDDLDKGRIVRSTYNRDPNNPTLDIIGVNDEGEPFKYTVHTSLLSQLHNPLRYEHRKYEYILNEYKKELAKGPMYGGFTQEEYDLRVQNLNRTRNVNELNLLYQKVFHGYNPGMPKTKSEDFNKK